MTEFSEKIKELVSCRDFVEHIGLTVNRSGFTVCPFHPDKDASLKIYRGNRGWCCFGCHKGGDVINMASLYYGTDFKETIRTLDEEFSLGLGLDAPPSAPERLLLAVQQARRRTTQEKEKRLRGALESEYWRAFDEWLSLERTIRDERPKAPGEEFSDAFVSSVKKMDAAKFELEYAEGRRYEYANK